jgi:hypothetical protein
VALRVFFPAQPVPGACRFPPASAAGQTAQKPEIEPVKSFRLAFHPAAFALVVPLLHAQQPLAPGPIPAPITSAHKLFIANAGMDAFSLQAFEELGLNGATPYDTLYSTVKSWGNLQLVSTPADADLVLEIRFTAPFSGGNGERTWDFQRILTNVAWQFQTEVTIYDAKTHFLLWRITQPVRPANLRGTWLRNIATADAMLAGDLKSLLTPSPAPAP